MTTVSNTSSAGSNAPVTAPKTQDANSNFMDFLKLLTTQLKNQDPTDPFDTKDITSQTAQLSTVQGINSLNTSMQNLLTAYSTAQTNSTVGYIGKRIESAGNSSVVQNGYGQLVYNLDAEADSAEITIKNAAGNTVYTGSAAKLSGRNVVYWAGNNSLNGNQEPDGVYTFSINAKDIAGNTVKATTYSSGTVTGVELTGTDGPVLELGNSTYTVPAASVIKIVEDPLAGVQPPAATNPSNS